MNHTKKKPIIEKQYCFRERRPSRDIQPEMRFNLKNYFKENNAESVKENKSRKTFLVAMQTFYNKISNNKHQIHNSNLPDVTSASHHRINKSVNLNRFKMQTSHENDEFNTSAKEAEPMDKMSLLAKTVLDKYHFFPKKNSSFLRQGEGKGCSNPLYKNSQVYKEILR